jgi:hypothetical protein
MRDTLRVPALVALLLTLVATVAPASQAADAPAPDVRKKQEIFFNEIHDHSAADAPFDVPVRASSGLTVELIVDSGPAVLDGGKLRLTGSPGLVVLRANQAGNAVYLPAKAVVRAFGVRPKPAPPEFTTQPEAMSTTVGGAIFISVGVSGEPPPSLQWRKDGNPIKGATERTFSIAQSGASDVGNYDVVASNPSGSATSQRIAIGAAKRSQFINFQTLAGPFVAGMPVTLYASSTSGLPVQFDVFSGVGFISGSTLTVPSSGTVTVRASQPGDPQFEAATPVTQTIAFGSGPGHF